MRAELRHDSVAAVVLDSGAPSLNEARRAPARAIADGSLAAVVLGTKSSKRGPLGAVLLVLAIALHAGAGLAALASRPGHSVQPIATRPPLRVEHVVDLARPEPSPAPPAPPPPVTKARVAVRVPHEPPAPTPPSESPPAPAEAGRIVAADESANQPLDFTAVEMSTGHGQGYAGGITTSSGTSSEAVLTPVVAGRVDRSARPGTSRARPVGPPGRDWDCPWPAEAEGLSFDEQFAIIRAVVRADGTVASAALISDPGHGFGAVALACARQQRFPAATDDEGRPITATSPPIRVRFTRP